MQTLTNDQVEHLPAEVRADLDAWIDSEGLSDKWILDLIVDDATTPGVLRATVIARADDGGPKIVGDTLIREQATFQIRSPLPASLAPFLR